MLILNFIKRIENYFMSRTLISNFRNEIQHFINLKKSAGFDYEHGISILHHIDLFLYNAEVGSKNISQKVWDKYCNSLTGISALTRYAKISTFSRFIKYLNSLGRTSYIGKLPKRPPDDYIPYIYSPKEMTRIFSECDKLVLKFRKKDSTIICIPAFIRLLYATGLRLDEAHSLLCDDVNLRENFIIVRKSKNCKERIIPISNSLSKVLLEYFKHRTLLVGNHKSTDFFFCRLNGEKIVHGVKSYFRKCLSNAGIRSIDALNGPRLHDLRHTFAIRAFQKLEKKGIPFFSALPALSIYLGHSHLQSTVYYLKFTFSRHPAFIKKLERAYPNTIPKLEHFNED